MNEWNPLLPLVGLVLGAILQYWFSRLAESRKQIQLLQAQSYVDYLRAVTKAAFATSADVVRSAKVEAADAKARLTVYGSTSVIAALARFEETGAVLDNASAYAAFVALVGQMREGSAAQPNDIKLVLFGR